MLKALGGLAIMLGVIAVAVLVPAGTLQLWPAWLFLAVFAAATLAITIDLRVRDPALLSRRLVAGPIAERRRVQQVIQGLASLAFLAIFVIAGLDHRAGGSRVPVAVVFAGDALVVAGLVLVARVFRANTFTAATVAVAADQAVVSTGPYAIVRHPMYTGALVMLIGTSLALASWWSELAVASLLLVLCWRVFDEEALLVRELAGYAAYRAQVRWRLVPYVW